MDVLHTATNMSLLIQMGIVLDCRMRHAVIVAAGKAARILPIGLILMVMDVTGTKNMIYLDAPSMETSMRELWANRSRDAAIVREGFK